jgi:hypothetical protein
MYVCECVDVWMCGCVCYLQPTSGLGRQRQKGVHHTSGQRRGTAHGHGLGRDFVVLAALQLEALRCVGGHPAVASIARQYLEHSVLQRVLPAQKLHAVGTDVQSYRRHMRGSVQKPGHQNRAPSKAGVRSGGVRSES